MISETVLWTKSDATNFSLVTTEYSCDGKHSLVTLKIKVSNPIVSLMHFLEDVLTHLHPSTKKIKIYGDLASHMASAKHPELPLYGLYLTSGVGFVSSRRRNCEVDGIRMNR